MGRTALIINFNIDELVEFMKECYDEMDFKERDFDFDYESTKTNLKHTIESNAYVDVRKENDSIVGAFIAFKVPSIVNHKKIRAVESVWHTKPTLKTRTRIMLMKSLLNQAVFWAESENLHLTVSANCNMLAAGRILEQAGFVKSEISYNKGVCHGS
jgi:hypothetical protein